MGTNKLIFLLAAVEFWAIAISLPNMERFVFPETAPAMVLRQVVFFPKSIMPLFIFEERYQHMLRESLQGNRLFTVINAAEDTRGHPINGVHQFATLGYIKACKENEDGTANLLLEGISRIKILQAIESRPYPFFQIRQVFEDCQDVKSTEQYRETVNKMLDQISAEREELSSDIVKYLQSIDDVYMHADHVASSMISSCHMKQSILATYELVSRYELLLQALEQEYSLNRQ